jgi:2-polyprenyl-3-methyl-5-hydroxy-6-metoxy-1,4-benzoquinol methylase
MSVMVKPISQRLIETVFSIPAAYKLAQVMIGARRGRDRFVQLYVRPQPGEQLLDIGCGTGDILEHLPATLRYTGFDPHEPYIRSARERWGVRGKFETGSVAAPPDSPAGYDLVIAQGVLHHLDDAAAAQLVTLARGALKPGGRLVTLDPVLHQDQGLVSRTLVSRDRGQFVRTPDAYERIFLDLGMKISGHVVKDMLYFPYSHFVGEAGSS